MRKRPLLLLACLFPAGILIWKYRAWALLPCALLPVLYIGKKERGKRRWLLLALSVFFLSAGMLRMGGEERFRSRYLPELTDGQEIRLAGEVSWIEKKSACVYVYLYLTDCVLSSRVPCNDVLAYVSADDVSIGQTLVVRGTISLFEEAPNEGGFNERAFYQSQKIDFGLWVSEVERVYETRRPWQRALFSLRERMLLSLESCGAEDGVISAMLLGEKSGLDSEVKGLYRRAGISHILAISGLHVSLLGIGFYHLLRRMGMCLAGAGGLTAAVMLGYGALTGAGVSSCRAIAMLFVMLLADVLGRSYDMLSALGLACLLILWENPFFVGFSGFWFSAAAVAGVGAGTLLAEWAFPREEKTKEGRRNRLRLAAEELSRRLCVSLGIQLAVLPLTAYCYYELPVYSLLLNTVVLTLVKELFVLGAAAAFAGMKCVWLGTALLSVDNAILHLYERLCRWTLKLPGAICIVGCPRPWQLAAYYALLLFALYVLYRRKLCEGGSPGENGGGRAPGQAQARTIRRAAELACLCAALFLLLAARPKQDFEIDVLDVGQGDGIYLQSDDGTAVFFDGGSTDVSSVGTYRILPFLKYRGVKKISFWFVSHTDADHVNGLMEVLESGYPVSRLVFAETVRREEGTLELAELAESCGTGVIYLKAGDQLSVGSLTFSCLYPEGQAEAGCVDLNELCLVLRLDCGGFSGLFAGDISSEVEAELMARGLCAPVDFYKAVHHGSKYSNSRAFLEALSPEVSVISCGENNRYGHPGAEAVANMEHAGSLVYYTMKSGQIKIRRQKGELLAAEPQKKP